MNPDKNLAKSIISDYKNGKYEGDTQTFIAHAYSATGEGALLAPVTNKNIGFLSQLALTLLYSLAQGSSESKSRSPWPTEEEKKHEIEKYKEGPAQDKGAVTSDYYKRLGVDRNATDAEIKSAHKKLLKEYHPDVLTAQGKTPEEIAEAEEKAKEINEAYYYLSREERREEYNKTWDRQYGNADNKAQPSKAETPLLKEQNEDISTQQEAPYLDIKYTPKKISSSSITEAGKLTGEFRETVGNVGVFSLDKIASGEMKFYSLFPESFSDSQVASALKMYADGVNPAQFAQKVIDSEILSATEKQELLNIAYFQEALASSGIEGLPSAEILAVAASSPEAEIAGAASFKTFAPGKFTFERRVAGKLSPLVQGGEKTLGKAITGETKGLAVKGIKLGARKLAKEGSKVAIQAGEKVAVKAGFSAILGGILETLGISVGGPVGALIAALITWLVTELIFGLIKLVKKILDPETITKMLLLAGAIFAGVGMTGAALFSAGAGAFSYFRNKGGGSFFKGVNTGVSAAGAAITAAIIAIVAAITWPIIVAFVIIPITFALILFMINSSAYVVPPWGTLALGGGQIENPYMKVTKTVRSIDTQPECLSNNNSPSNLECANSDIPVKVEYTITIEALRGPITINTINNNCTFTRKTGATGACFGPTPPNPGDITPTTAFTFTYQDTYDSSYTDTQISDVVSVSATTSEGGSTSSGASASICIGDCPSDCPYGWPILPQAGQSKLYVTQGPYASATHSQVEAIDITSDPIQDPGHASIFSHVVTATHSGVACVSSGSSGNYGKVVWIIGQCDGTEFASVYAHLGSNEVFVSNGQRVSRGQQLGLADDTGGWNFPHLHYEFSQPGSGTSCSYFSSGGWSSSNRGPIIMAPKYLPETVDVGCFGQGNCSVDIP